jgi:DNA replication and repair protein RecF
LLLLKDISLVQFKNYDQAAFQFRERIVGICGNNGIGKTNLLDAIYYLCFTKSYFTKSDQLNVYRESGSPTEGGPPKFAGFRIEGHFEREGNAAQVCCILRDNGKKEFSCDGIPYEKFSAHIGRFPCVIIAPDDVQIITGGSEERRRFLDALLSQLDATYLQSLIEYNRVLQQRNGFLRSLTDSRLREQDRQLLDVYDGQLIGPGSWLFEKRHSFMRDLLPLVKSFYTQIAGEVEPLELIYESQLLQHPFPDILSRFREKDLLLQRTGGGIHKDDIDMNFSTQPFKTTASQGQRKSLLFALKLAEYDMLRKIKGFPPLLLLDDVFEKLDEPRMHNLLDKVCVQNQGQIFITDTHAGRIEQELGKLSIPCQIIQL